MAQSIKRHAAHIVQELEHAASLLTEDAGERLTEAILGAEHIFVAGAGRSGLMMKAFAMRLMHLGLQAHVVGETVTPGITKGDLLLIGSGSGETQTLIGMAEKAKALDADVAALTIQPQSTIGARADIVVQLPGAPKDQASGRDLTVQPMGSLFEQTLLVVLDAVILRIMESQRQNSGKMYGNHANLE
ncbi:6-phospho-3-hexuloisomerase [Paenibacillus lautus]|uniref:6-phospho-3-hexuloisomerase n=1 Tax=Paenibacillus TaxID=44249 RepID=UPI0010EB349D|nr:6-phospho-3-hexuloisomerase [Paenibacillus sp. BR1-192]MBY0158739.1 6-phospho-3-hexuloisomerase [Cytobacillus firmus]WFB56876.1 6-phospho-3-hexuloisomerase [Paenibacillus sp. BR1-192]VTR43885.1 3-hexulose-6-phosphate isomerase [Actinobacillus pleuropneumoniae]